MGDMDAHIFPFNVLVFQTADLADPQAGRIKE